MTVSLIEELRERIPPGCEARECRDADCSASLVGIGADRLLVDLDCDELGLQSVKHADFVLVTGNGWVACAELKGGTLRGAESQLQSSASFVESMLVDVGLAIRFRPVLVHRQEFGGARVREWAKRQVTFRGRQYAIQRIRCGEPLAKALG